MMCVVLQELIIFRLMYNIIMNDEEGEFPFEEFVEWLQERGDLRKKLKTVTTAICENNVYSHSNVATGSTPPSLPSWRS